MTEVLLASTIRVGARYARGLAFLTPQIPTHGAISNRERCIVAFITLLTGKIQ